ncbi:ketoacyl-ACP synthase III [Spirosoma sp. RP8]|uniref:Beta-ketoacyl-[acyl-carrier-protein] synthase III n=1 Tax=Spirosoma liriopis TaxID=2937440 RepID=A0ABT0HNH0_9BACT|nr:beta-ketoacyl-ACP synthase III [Spirosoma liriopis]MCK8493719.1 ketoacyl-ACP synthase III [Spirosoma liriopis]
MKSARIAGLGYYVPERVVPNVELAPLVNVSDEWIQGRTGIEQRHYRKKHGETTTTMGAAAARIAIDRAGILPADVDFIIFATLSPDYYFPGNGVLLQRELGITHRAMGALDIRNQCSGFIYALSIADQFVKTGKYKNVLIVGAETHSRSLDFSPTGRDVTILFGDGAGAAVIQPCDEPGRGILTTHLHADGTYAEELACFNPGAHGGYYLEKESLRFTEEEINSIAEHDDHAGLPYMNGQTVLRHAVTRFPEVINEALDEMNLLPKDIDLLVPHQANLRIAQLVQKRLGLSDEKVFNNIHKFGNTTAASIPIALCEAWEQGKIEDGALLCVAAFGSGFTWGSALIRW